MTHTEESAELFQQGAELLLQGSYEKRIAVFSKAIKRQSGFEAAYLSRAVAFLQTEKPQEALTDLNQAIGSNKKNPRAYHLRGVARHKLGDNEKALEDFGKAIEVNPEYGSAYLSRANLHSEMGNTDKAGFDMEMVRRLTQKNVETYAADNNRWRTRDAALKT